MVFAGKRKSSVSRVHIKSGSGNVTINGKSFEDYFPVSEHRQEVLTALTLVDSVEKFDIFFNVNGGGIVGQAEATKFAIAKALENENSELRSVLKEAGLLTRDARVKERKKPGLRKARRARQFSKR